MFSLHRVTTLNINLIDLIVDLLILVIYGSINNNYHFLKKNDYQIKDSFENKMYNRRKINIQFVAFENHFNGHNDMRIN